MMFKLLNVEPENYSPEARSIISEFAEITELNATRNDLIKNIDQFDILITRLSHNIDKEVLNAAKNLKIIVSATTGLNHIDVDFAEEKGIMVLSLKGETDFLKNITATAEHTWGLLLSLIRKLNYAFKDVLEGNWRRDQFVGRELKGKTLGIIGYGRLGSMVAAYGKAFQMKVCAYDPFRKDKDVNWLSVDELLNTSDVVSLHIPFNKETKMFFNTSKFAQMKSDAVLINTSRGEVIDESALLVFLKSNKIAGAALDVLSGEKSFRSGVSDWPKSDPLVLYARAYSNLILSPHIGGLTVDSIKAVEIFMARRLVSNLKVKGFIN